MHFFQLMNSHAAPGGLSAWGLSAWLVIFNVNAPLPRLTFSLLSTTEVELRGPPVWFILCQPSAHLQELGTACFTFMCDLSQGGIGGSQMRWNWRWSKGSSCGAPHVVGDSRVRVWAPDIQGWSGEPSCWASFTEGCLLEFCPGGGDVGWSAPSRRCWPPGSPSAAGQPPAMLTCFRVAHPLASLH